MRALRHSIDRATMGLLGAAIILLMVVARKLYIQPPAQPRVTSALAKQDAALDVWAARWRAQEIDPTTFYRLASRGARVGPSDPDVTILVFMNFACGHCAALDVTLSRLIARYPDHVAVVFRHFAPTAERGLLRVHLAAECAQDQGVYAEFHHAAYANPAWIGARDGWERVGAAAGVPDVARFVGCTRAEIDRSRLIETNSEGEKLGVIGTPTSFVNGIRVVGEIPFETLDSLVAYQLDRLRPKLSK